MLLIARQLLSVAAATQIVEVTVARGDIRSGPNAASDIMAEVHQGEKYPTLEKRGEWYQIRLVDGREVYIHESSVVLARSRRVSHA